MVRNQVSRAAAPGCPGSAVEAADLGGDRPLVVEHEHVEVRRQRWQPAARRAERELVAPLAEQATLGDHESSEPARARP